jgi:putative transposase
VTAVAELQAGGASVRRACAALALAPASYYRALRPPAEPQPRSPKSSPRALVPSERQRTLELLHAPRFVDRSPHQVYATLLDEGQYLCSPRTMYRILDANREVRERRDQCRRPHHTKPQLVARQSNQAWSWDITKLLTLTKGSYLYLYVLLDLYSRFIVGWLLATRESGRLAMRLIRETCAKQGIGRAQLTIHSDRGTAPTAKAVTQLYADLDIVHSLSRPRVSNDNPFSEALFKTLQYAPGAPDRFVGLEHGRQWAGELIAYYNHHHRHSGLAYLTPAMVHLGQADLVLAQRQQLLDAAYARHPERFPNGPPHHPALPTEVWINPPEDRTLAVTDRPPRSAQQPPSHPLHCSSSSTPETAQVQLLLRS